MTGAQDGQARAAATPEPGEQRETADQQEAYLLGLRLRGRRVLVVGGGVVAARRVPRLLGAGADVALVSPSVTPALEELAARGRLDWLDRGYAAGDCAGAWLVIAATDRPEVNAAVAAEAEANRTWCVRADAAGAATAWTPASGAAEGTSVGVLSGDPRHSAAIRDVITAGLRSGAIAARHHRRRPAGVALVGGGPGDPGLITVRGRQLLAEADVVIADRLGPRELLAELPPDVTVIDAGKVPYRRQMSQEEINEALVAHATSGKFVVRLKGGDPFVFGRGGEEMLACLRAGVPVTVVPGVSSAVGVPDRGRPAGDPPGDGAGLPRDLGARAAGRRALHGGLARARPVHRDAGAADVAGAHWGGRENPGETRTTGELPCFGNRGRYHAHTTHNLFNAR